MRKRPPLSLSVEKGRSDFTIFSLSLSNLQSCSTLLVFIMLSMGNDGTALNGSSQSKSAEKNSQCC